MSDFTAEDLANELSSDGLEFPGLGWEPYDLDEYFLNAESGRGTIRTLALGDFEVVEAETGKSGEIIDDLGSGGNVWRNWVILKQGNRYFRLNGTYDSWDAQGWDGKAEEVEAVEKTITVWEKKLDY